MRDVELGNPWPEKENGGEKKRGEQSNEVTFGLGYYRKSGMVQTELMGGAGFGSVNFTNVIDLHPDYHFEMRADKFNLYLQPNVGFRRKAFDFAGFMRFNHVRFSDIATILDPGASSDIVPEDQTFMGRRRMSVSFLEPGVSFKVGGKYVKAYTSLSHSINLGPKLLRYREFSVFFGCAFSVSKHESSK
jgi:hypothetical protein